LNSFSYVDNIIRSETPVVENLLARCHITHQGAISHDHLSYCLDKYNFRFYRRASQTEESRSINFSQRAVATTHTLPAIRKGTKLNHIALVRWHCKGHRSLHRCSPKRDMPGVRIECVSRFLPRGATSATVRPKATITNHGRKNDSSALLNRFDTATFQIQRFFDETFNEHQFPPR